MKKIKYLLMIPAAALIMTSCEKELNLQPTDTFTEENAFQTLFHLQQGTYAAYARYGAYLNNMYVSALLSDEAKLGSGNAGQGALTYRYQFSSDGTTGGDVVAAFGSYYSLIDQTNRVLAAFPKVTVTPSQEARKSVLEGQLKALRAIGHFGLLQAYSKNYDASTAASDLGIPIMLASNPTGKPARNTIAEVIAQIESDLSSAKTILANEPFSDTVMNKVNIAAYQARIALYKGEYEAAANFATEVISAGVKSLATISGYPQIWKDEDYAELLFRVRYENSPAVGGLWTTTSNVIYIAPSDKLAAAYGAGDVRLNTFIGTNSSGNKYVNKFYQSSVQQTLGAVDMKACRISEMYLIRAEANAKKASPDLAAAAADLNLLRSRRINGYIDQTFGTATELANAVMDERFKELCFEGFRFFDLKRNNMPVQRNSSDASPEWQTLPAGDYRFVLPIPRDELNVNPNMVQNPGYN